MKPAYKPPPSAGECLIIHRVLLYSKPARPPSKWLGKRPLRKHWCRFSPCTLSTTRKKPNSTPPTKAGNTPACKKKKNSGSIHPSRKTSPSTTGAPKHPPNRAKKEVPSEIQNPAPCRHPVAGPHPPRHCRYQRQRPERHLGKTIQ